MMYHSELTDSWIEQGFNPTNRKALLIDSTRVLNARDKSIELEQAFVLTEFFIASPGTRKVDEDSWDCEDF